MTEQPKVRHRSVSQIKEYDPERGGCPHRYKLHRIDRVWEKPAAWSPQGSAVHYAIEVYEKSGRKMSLDDMLEAFDDSYSEHINELCETTPNFSEWFRSGGYRRTVEEDIERRWGIGREQVERYYEYTLAHPEEVPLEIDGEPAIEVPFEINLGGVVVKGYIDQIVWHPVRKCWVVRDVKTGKEPGDDFQLAVYRIAMWLLHGIDAPIGDYWMAVSGKPTFPYELDAWPEELLAKEFARLEAKIQAGEYEPNPTPDGCKMCSVNWKCDFKVADNF